MLDLSSLMNIENVDVEKLYNPTQRATSTSTHKASNTLKKSLQRLASLKGQKSTNKQSLLQNTDDPRQYEMQYDELTEEELTYAIQVAQTDSQSNDRLKVFLRCNYWPISHRIRGHLWRCLLKIPRGDTKIETDYLSDLSSIFGKTREININMPSFVSESNHFNYFYLNESGKDAVKRILCVYAYRYPDITYSPGLVSICSLLLHYLQEYEVYAAICHLFASKDYLVATRSSWETNCLVFVKLLKYYSKSHYDLISKNANEPVEKILMDWFWWIFDEMPFDYVVKIMDCYLYEGQKVFFRIAIAVVQLFTKTSKNENFQVSSSAMKQFCRTSLEPIDKLLRAGFGIRNFKRSTIKDLYVKETKNVSRSSIFRNDAQTYSDDRPESPEGSYPESLDSQSKIRQLNDTLKLDNLRSIVLPPINTAILNHSQKTDSDSLNNSFYTNNKSPAVSSLWLANNFDSDYLQISCLSHQNFHQLWNWIPQRLTVYNPKLVFTSLEHGTSLHTLYSILDELEYCFIVVKTFNDEVFGAFCSGSWTERKQKSKYFGNGETFLFSLIPKANAYFWVGKQLQKTLHNQEMFIRADNSLIAIGGGGADGLLIMGNLSEGHTNSCDTFNNSPLCSEQAFQISVIEIITFTNNQ